MTAKCARSIAGPALASVVAQTLKHPIAHYLLSVGHCRPCLRHSYQLTCKSGLTARCFGLWTLHPSQIILVLSSTLSQKAPCRAS